MAKYQQRQQQQKLNSGTKDDLLLVEGDAVVEQNKNNELEAEIELSPVQITTSQSQDDAVIDPELVDPDSDLDPDRDITLKLEKLRRLKEKGVITEENFRIKEKELLDRFL